MKKLFLSIFILTIVDALCTALGVRSGHVEEANPFLQSIFHASPEAAGALIVVFVGAMLMVIFHYRHRIRWINYGLGVMIVVKLAILGLHVNWISQII